MIRAWLERRRQRKYGHLAGFGPRSDGVPLQRGSDEGPSRPRLAPRGSEYLVAFDKTIPMLKGPYA